eukprot:3116435-Rhodomonas_salina.3
MAAYEVGMERSVLDDIRFGLESSNTSVVLAAMKQLADYLSSLSMGGAADAENITVDELLDIVALSAKAYGEKLNWMGDVDTGEPVVSVSKMNSTGAALFSTGVGGVGSVGLISDMLMHAIIEAFLNSLHNNALGKLQLSSGYQLTLQKILALSLINGVPIPRGLFVAANMRIRDHNARDLVNAVISNNDERYLKLLTSTLISALGLRLLPTGGVAGKVVSVGTYYLRMQIAKQVASLLNVIMQAQNPFENIAPAKISAFLQYLGSWFTGEKFATLTDKIKRAYMRTTGFGTFSSREEPPISVDSVYNDLPSVWLAGCSETLY